MEKAIISLLYLSLIMFLASCGGENRQRSISVTKEIAETQKQTTEIKVSLQPHKFSASNRPGRSRSQIRAVVSKGTLTKEEFMQLAVRLCNKYKSQPNPFLVTFFDSESCLKRWDGTGLIQDSDWPHWLCRIAVDTDPNGNLFARTFKLALNAKTGLKRKDVLREK